MMHMNNNVTPTNSTSVVPAPIVQITCNNTSGGMGMSITGSPASSNASCMQSGDRMIIQPPRYLASPAAAAAVYAASSNPGHEHGPNNFATIRTTSIVTKQQKEHMQVKYKLIY